MDKWEKKKSRSKMPKKTRGWSKKMRGRPRKTQFRKGRVSAVTNEEYECKWPNAEKLVSQLYKVCLEEGACFANLGGNGKCIAELNSKYSYVNSELKVFITSDNFRSIVGKKWEPRNPVPGPFSAKIRKVNQNSESRREFGK